MHPPTSADRAEVPLIDLPPPTPCKRAAGELSGESTQPVKLQKLQDCTGIVHKFGAISSFYCHHDSFDVSWQKLHHFFILKLKPPKIVCCHSMVEEIGSHTQNSSKPTTPKAGQTLESQRCDCFVFSAWRKVGPHYVFKKINPISKGSFKRCHS